MLLLLGDIWCFYKRERETKNNNKNNNNIIIVDREFKQPYESFHMLQCIKSKSQYGKHNNYHCAWNGCFRKPSNTNM